MSWREGADKLVRMARPPADELQLVAWAFGSGSASGVTHVVPRGLSAREARPVANAAARPHTRGIEKVTLRAWFSSGLFGPDIEIRNEQKPSM